MSSPVLPTIATNVMQKMIYFDVYSCFYVSGILKERLQDQVLFCEFRNLMGFKWLLFYHFLMSFDKKQLGPVFYTLFNPLLFYLLFFCRLLNIEEEGSPFTFRLPSFRYL